MRFRKWWTVAVAPAVLAVAAFGGQLSEGAALRDSPAGRAARDSILTRDTKVTEVYALGAAVLYRRRGAGTAKRPWMRIVRGRRMRVNGLPRGRFVFGETIARDSAGRVVVTVSVYRNRTTWWTYDVAGDVARPLRGLRCARGEASDASVWRARVAYFCGSTVVLRDGARTQRFAGVEVLTEPGIAQLALRGRSLAAYTEMDEDVSIVRLIDRGRRCPRKVGDGGSADGSWWARGLWFGASGLEWAMARGTTYGDPRPRFRDLAIRTVDLGGRCERSPVVRQLALTPPPPPMRALAIDGRWLYYATASAIHRRRLPLEGRALSP